MDSSGSSAEIVSLGGLIHLQDLPSTQPLLVPCQWFITPIYHGCRSCSNSPAYCQVKQGCHLSLLQPTEAWTYGILPVCTNTCFKFLLLIKVCEILKAHLFLLPLGKFVQDVVNTWKSAVICVAQLFSYIKKLKCSKQLSITKSMLHSAIILRLVQTARKESGCWGQLNSWERPATRCVCTWYSCTHKRGIRVNGSTGLSMVFLFRASSLTSPGYSTECGDTHKFYCSIKAACCINADPRYRSRRHS